MQDSPDGVTLAIKVIPNARKNCIGDWKNGELEIRVTAVPDKGLANKAVIALLSKSWKVPKSRFKILRGQSSRHKVLLIEGWQIKDLPAQIL